MDEPLHPTTMLLRRSKELGYPLGKRALFKLVRLGFVDRPKKRPGKGRGKGKKPALWSTRSLRQVSEWCRLRRAGLRGKRLALAMWWETGCVTPQARSFVVRLFESLEWMLRSSLRRRNAPQSPSERRAAVTNYIGRTSSNLSPADAFGENRGLIELAAIGGLAGLFKTQGRPEDQVEKVWPEVAKLGSVRDVTALLSDPEAWAQGLRALGLLILAVAPYASLRSFGSSLELLSPLDRKGTAGHDEAQALMGEVRTYLRNGVALLVRQARVRHYWRLVRRILVPWGGQMRSAKMPRSVARYRDLLNREGAVATGVLLLLLVHQFMRESRIDGGLRALNLENWGVRRGKNSTEPAAG